MRLNYLNYDSAYELGSLVHSQTSTIVNCNSLFGKSLMILIL